VVVVEADVELEADGAGVEVDADELVVAVEPVAVTDGMLDAMGRVVVVLSLAIWGAGAGWL